MSVAGLSFLFAGLLQLYLTHPEEECRGRVHLAWQLPQFFLISVGEVLVAITGLEFAYSQAPPTYRYSILLLPTNPLQTVYDHSIHNAHSLLYLTALHSQPCPLSSDSPLYLFLPTLLLTHSPLLPPSPSLSGLSSPLPFSLSTLQEPCDSLMDLLSSCWDTHQCWSSTDPHPRGVPILHLCCCHGNSDRNIPSN